MGCFCCKKIHFPKLNKCYLCYCMEFETSIKICSIIMAVLGCLSTLGIYNKTGSLIGSLVSIIVSVSLIFLTIGLYTNKLSFMKQFIYIYLIYLIISLIAIVIAIGAFIYFIINYGKIYNTIERTVNFVTDTPEVEQTSLITTLSFYLVFIVIYYLLEVYYYIATVSFIKQAMEDTEDIKYSRRLEGYY